jgi:hypothetical protein
MILLDLGQAAAKLQCSERWLADNLRSGRFPAKKIARKWMLSDDDISAILQICSVNESSKFSADSSNNAAALSSMTKTSLRRLQKNISAHGRFIGTAGLREP